MRRVFAYASLLLAAVVSLGAQAPAAPPSASPSASATPVTRERALEIARKKLAEAKPEASFVVLEKKTVEKPFGWVFFYEPKAAATDPMAAVPGAGPLVVHRDGTTTFLSSSVPPNVAIEEYEKAWLKRKR